MIYYECRRKNLEALDSAFDFDFGKRAGPGVVGANAALEGGGASGEIELAVDAKEFRGVRNLGGVLGDAVAGILC